MIIIQRKQWLILEVLLRANGALCVVVAGWVMAGMRVLPVALLVFLITVSSTMASALPGIKQPDKVSRRRGWEV